VVPVAALGRHPLFDGLDATALEEVLRVLRPRRFAAAEPLCLAGETGEELLVIADGLAYVSLPDAAGRERVVARLRRGEVVGEMSFMTGEPRTATVLAAVPLNAFELRNEDLARVIARRPALLANLARILARRLAETTAEAAGSRLRGEAVALIVGRAARDVALAAVAAAARAGAHHIAAADPGEPFGELLTNLDDLLEEHSTVVVSVDADSPDLELVLGQVDRAVALVDGDDLVSWPEAKGRPELEFVATRDPAWLGRHLTRTKLGLALGAGGAKGYAHVGVLKVLENAGQAVDYLSGSSIGGVVGAWIALGLGADEVEAAMRRAFTAENVANIFRLSMSGGSSGLETVTRVFRETTGDATFDDLVVPLAIMTVDLVTRRPAIIVEGPLWQALVAATALPGMFPPYESEGRRLVDGLALVPVPTREVAAAGADLTCSVNLISRDTLPAWPGQTPPDEPSSPAKSRMLETLLEVMDLSQLDSSERHTALADVPITPRFGPSTWRDFQLADLFLEAGRLAAEERLPQLSALTRLKLSRPAT
jgi:NTE family protein